MMQPSYKVLLVDDDPSMLRLLSRWLEKAGYSVRTADDGQEALEAIENECPDFLVTDWEMPRLSGLELCRLTRELPLPHYVCVVFLTARTGAVEMIAGLDNGADDFLTKPVTEGALLARMRSSCRILELERSLSRMARTDSLTGLLTQRTFYEWLEREWQRAKRYSLPLSCVMVDLDFFKRINDVYGHPVGDSVLKYTAEMLQDSCRASDLACRYGGEEFCILLTETNENGASIWAERTRARLASLHVPCGLGNFLRITGSFGVAQCDGIAKTSESLVNLADQALLEAKRAGRDRTVRYSSLAKAAESGTKTGVHYEGLFEDLAARDAMHQFAVGLRESDTIDEAADFFLNSGMSSTPVLNARGGMAGFVSEKDIMVAMVAPDGWRQPVSAVMKSNVISYEEDTPLQTVYEFLCRVSIQSVVITQNGCPTGIISRDSLLRWFRNREGFRGGGAPTTLLTPALHVDNTPGTASV